MMDALLFYACVGVALASGAAVVLQRSPIGSALALVVTLCSLSAIYGLLGSPFIAVLQIVVYAGAIMVLFLFVIMLLHAPREEHPPGERRGLEGAAAALAVLFLLQVGSVLVAADVKPGRAGFSATTEQMARVLFSQPYVYVFEATSILILAALVGAVVLAKKELS